MLPRLSPRALIVFILGLVVGAAGAGFAVASAAAGPAPVVACVAAKTRVLSLAASGRCPRGASKVSWAQVGPRGPVGPDGPPGAAAAPGTGLSGDRYRWVWRSPASTNTTTDATAVSPPIVQGPATVWSHSVEISDRDAIAQVCSHSFYIGLRGPTTRVVVSYGFEEGWSTIPAPGAVLGSGEAYTAKVGATCMAFVDPSKRELGFRPVPAPAFVFTLVLGAAPLGAADGGLVDVE